MRILAAMALLAATGCGKKEDPHPSPKETPVPATAEPERIRVQHILISFAGAGTQAKRTKDAAEKLAHETLARAKKGEDFGKLVRELSDDSGEGIYGLCNRGLSPKSPDEYPRDGMVPAFGNVGFKLEAGGIGLATYDPQTSPYGWHIIKRLK